MALAKYRIRFRKGGDLRLVGHHDLLRCFERMLRRAGLPFHLTRGFNPKPRLVFALSLGLGIIGNNEVLELELDEVIPAEELADRLSAQAPQGLDILSVRSVEPRVKARVVGVEYRVRVPADRAAGLPERVARFLAAADWPVERRRPAPRRIDLRAFVRDLSFDGEIVSASLRVGNDGAARPDEILEALGLGDLPASGAVIERSRVDIADEIGGDAAAGTHDLNGHSGLIETGAARAGEAPAARAPISQAEGNS